MARVKDLWFSEVKDPRDPAKKIKKKTARHPDNGGSKGAKRWLAVWIDPDGKEKTKAFRIQDTAKKYGRKQEEDIERDEYIDPEAGKQLFSPLARKWLSLRTVGGTSSIKYERTLRLHIEPTFGHRQVKSVRPSEVAAWLLDLSKTHGPSVQEQALFILRGVFTLAIADGIIKKGNPAKSEIIPKPKQDDQSDGREVWTTARTSSVIEAHPEEYRLIPTVGAGCGLRECEAFGLDEDDFDFAAGKLHVRRQIAQVGKTWVFKLPKGGRERTVPLSRGVASAARAFIEARPPRPYALPWMQENGEFADPVTVKLMFRWHGDDPRTHDKHVRPRNYGKAVWTPACAEAGIIPPPVPGPRGGTARGFAALDRDDNTHALRHWFSTTLQDADNISLAAVMDFLGHSRKSQSRLPITVRVYGHVTEEAFEAARVAIDRTLFRLRPVQDRTAAGTVTELAAGE